MLTAYLVAVLVYAYCTSSLTTAQQDGCDGPPSNDSEVEALIAHNYAGGSQGITPPAIVLQVSPAGFKYRVVCLSSSGIRNRYRFVSIVAYFTTSDANVSQSGDPVYGQFEFECVKSTWSATSRFLEDTALNRVSLTATSAAINASLRTDCAYCLSSSTRSPPRSTDVVNHCSS